MSGPELGAANMASQNAEVAPVLAAAREIHLQRSVDTSWLSRQGLPKAFQKFLIHVEFHAIGLKHVEKLLVWEAWLLS